MKIFSFLKSIDEALFRKCDEWRNSEQFQRFHNQIIVLDPPIRELLQLGFFAVILLLPIITLLIILFFNLSIKSSIGHKEDILQEVNALYSLNSVIEQYRPFLFTSEQVSSEADLQNTLTQNQNLQPLSSKIQFTSLIQNALGQKYSVFEAAVNLNGISTQQFSQLMELLYQKYKVRLTSVSLNRDRKQKLLSGQLNFKFYSASY